MSDFPVIPINIAHYIADTQNLKHDDHGIYFLLLINMWRENGYLKFDTKELAKLCKCSRLRFEKFWEKNQKYFKKFSEIFEEKSENFSFISQKRLLVELTKLQNSREISATFGALGAQKRWGNKGYSMNGSGSHPNSPPINGKDSPPILARGTLNSNSNKSKKPPIDPPTGDFEENKNEENNFELLPPDPELTPSQIAKRMLEIWNEQLAAIYPNGQLLTENRQRVLVARYSDSFKKDFDEWLRYCQLVASNPFFLGDNKNGWKVDVDFATRLASIAKVREGKYDRAPAQNQANSVKDEIRRMTNALSAKTRD